MICHFRLLALKERSAFLELDSIEDDIDAWAFQKLYEAHRYFKKRKSRKSIEEGNGRSREVPRYIIVKKKGDMP
jgi:hypothetical protein